METPSKGAIDSNAVPPQSTTPTPTETAPQQESKGGVTEYLKSWIGGSDPNSTQPPEAEPKTIHTEELKDGSSAAVQTVPDAATVPQSLQESPHTVGTAKTSIQPPVSEYATALEGIAGQPVAPDPTAKYGPALGPLTGDAPTSGQGTGVVGAVAAAAGSVVQSVKHVVGYEGDSAQTGNATNNPSTGNVSQPGTGGTTNEPLTVRTGTEDQTGSGSAPVPGQEGGTSSGGVLTPADLPKSGVVNATEDGAASVSPRQQPGYLASAAGTVSNAAAGLRDTVAGYVGGGGASGTAGNAAPSESYVGEPVGSRSTEPQGAASKPGVQYEEEAPAAGGSSTAAATTTSGHTPSAPTSNPSANAGSSAAGAGVPSTTAAAPTSTSAGTTPSTNAADAKSAGPASTPTEGSAAIEAGKSAPEATKAATTGSTPASTKTAPTTESSATGSKTQPPVSAFASQNLADKKAGEITEDAGSKKAATGSATGTGAATGGSATTGGASTAGKAGTQTAEQEKAKSKCCGCVIQ